MCLTGRAVIIIAIVNWCVCAIHNYSSFQSDIFSLHIFLVNVCAFNLPSSILRAFSIFKQFNKKTIYACRDGRFNIFGLLENKILRVKLFFLSCYRWYARLQLCMGQLFWDHIRTVLLQISTCFAASTRMGEQSWVFDHIDWKGKSSWLKSLEGWGMEIMD